MAKDIDPGRKGDWMQTATGRKVWPLDPRPEDFCIEDIARGLSNLCRYGGQIRNVRAFFSVAEHSILLASVASPKNRRAALMHDSSEAFIGDIVRPLKPFLPEYKTIENEMMCVIAQKFEFEWPMPAEIVELNYRICRDERAAIMAKTDDVWDVDHLEPLGVGIRCLTPAQAEFEFMMRFHDYFG